MNTTQKTLHEFQEPIQAVIRKKILHLQSTDVENEEDKVIETNKNVQQRQPSVTAKNHM